MFVTKYTHSCLLVETENTNYLIDPGVYSTAYILDLNKVPQLHYLLITHEHEDHMDLKFIKEVVNRFPKIKIKSTETVVEMLKSNSIEASVDSDEKIKVTSISHESLFDKEPPLNVAFTIEENFAHVGDSFGFSENVQTVAFPIQAPWGSFTVAIEKIKALGPKKVIPIHDWHWKDEVRQSMQKRAQKYLSDFGIDFIPMENSERVEV